MKPKTAIYKATVKSQFGDFVFAVDSTEYDAKYDIMTVAMKEFAVPAAMLKVGDVTKSTRKLVANMHQIKLTDWAWVQK